MGNPKLHHYVPQFYLRRFLDSDSRLWVWDRRSDRIFPTTTGSIAAESNFYLLSYIAEQGGDPLTLERQLADLEGEVSMITGQWLEWISQDKYDALIVPDINREIVSLFLAVQFLRTADTRSTLAAFYRTATGRSIDSDHEMRALHAELLWNDEIISKIAGRIRGCTWLFGHNGTPTPFIASDNPVAFRTSDNRMWLKAGILSKGAYLVYPLAPNAVLYCYPDENPWQNSGISQYDCHISPVVFTESLVRNENSAQVFMASRFVISNRPTFDAEREFAKTIGTDINAPPGRKLFG
ncbi:DUF4238 domain-containing protein [Nonomuraea sp. KM88]|uniref:DUF4238 domain-containing protein n=1 Tax=Nonomuraea sp. KM88 TaxID=3457427 RepID=UPI003FCDC276